MKAEQLAHRHSPLKAFLAEIPWTKWAAIGLHFHLNAQAQSDEVQQVCSSLDDILRAIHVCLGDEKGAEDLHHFFMDETRRRRFQNLTCGRLMRSCIDSKVPVKMQFASLSLSIELATAHRSTLFKMSLKPVFTKASSLWRGEFY